MRKLICLLVILLCFSFPALAVESPTVGPTTENLEGIELIFDESLENTLPEVIVRLGEIYGEQKYICFERFLIGLEGRYGLTEWRFTPNFTKDSILVMVLVGESTYILEGVGEGHLAVFDFSDIPEDIYAVYIFMNEVKDNGTR